MVLLQMILLVRMLLLRPDNHEWSISRLSVVMQLPLMLYISRQMVGLFDYFSRDLFKLLTLKIIFARRTAGDGERMY